MTQITFSSITEDLKKASQTIGHPFRYFTLATTDSNGTPRLRTLVLREVDEQLNLIAYTDKRSTKVTHINKYNIVGLLFFDHDRLIQLSIRAKAQIITDQDILRNTWAKIPQKSRKEYMTEMAPGKEIKTPEKIDFLKEKHFFTMIKLTPHKIEYLGLNRPNNIRILFKNENGEWVPNYLVP